MKNPFPNALKKNLNLLVVLTMALSPVWHHVANAQQSPVPAQSASAGDILISGKLACSLKRTVIMPFFGVITALPVQAGQRVTSGQLLGRYRLLPESIAKIRSRQFPAEIRDLEMSQVKLAAKLSELEKQRTGLQRLAAENLTSQRSLNQVEQEISLIHQEKNAIAERLGWARQRHQDDVTLLQKQLGGLAATKNIPNEGKLSAPMDGFVIWLHPDVRVGAELKPEVPLFIIGNLDTLIVKAQVHELEAMRLQLGDQAEVQVVSLPGKTFLARVSRVSWSSMTSAPDQPSFFEVEFSVSNPDHILKDGLKVQLTVPKAPSS